MKHIEQLNLMCDKVEIVMSIDAWYVLHGTTDNRSNLLYFLSLLSKMVTLDTELKKRGQTYNIKPGQADCSMLGLSAEWGIGRKAIRRLMDDFSNTGLITVESNPLTTIISLLCVKRWMIGGQPVKNPVFQASLKENDGVRLYLVNGQQFGKLHRSKTKRKADKTKDNLAEENHNESNQTGTIQNEKSQSDEHNTHTIPSEQLEETGNINNPMEQQP